MIVVIDSNVLVSAFIRPTGPPGQILDRVGTGAFRLVTTRHLWDEFCRVLETERVRRAVLKTHTPSALRTLREGLAAVCMSVRSVRPRQNWVPEDPDDDWVVQCAITARADRIVSGDRHLVAHNPIAGIVVVSPAEFITEIRAAER